MNKELTNEDIEMILEGIRKQLEKAKSVSVTIERKERDLTNGFAETYIPYAVYGVVASFDIDYKELVYVDGEREAVGYIDEKGKTVLFDNKRS